MLPVRLYLVLAKVVTLLAGGLVTLQCVRAYRRTGSPALRALAVGIGLVTLGGLVAGGVDYATAMEVETAIAVQSTFSAVGFLALAGSLLTDG